MMVVIIAIAIVIIIISTSTTITSFISTTLMSGTGRCRSSITAAPYREAGYV